MTTEGIRQRQMPATVPVIERLKAQRAQAAPQSLQQTETTEQPASTKTEQPQNSQHPGGEIKHGVLAQALRMCLFAAYFNGSIIASVYRQLMACIGH
jgi:lysocardiolipin and lysophospholipid acyltransferase